MSKIVLRAVPSPLPDLRQGGAWLGPTQANVRGGLLSKRSYVFATAEKIARISFEFRCHYRTILNDQERLAVTPRRSTCMTREASELRVLALGDCRVRGVRTVYNRPGAYRKHLRPPTRVKRCCPALAWVEAIETGGCRRPQALS